MVKGINICNHTTAGLSGWAKQELQPIFLRLATIPHFFGMEPGEFPEPIGLVHSMPGSNSEFDQTGTTWDYLVNRTVRLVRRGLAHHQGPLKHKPAPESLVQEQHQLLRCLNIWNHHYKSANIAAIEATGDDFESHLHRQMEGIIGKIWVTCCLSSNKMRYDEHTEDFEEVLRISQGLIDRRSLKGRDHLPKFIFEMGL